MIFSKRNSSFVTFGPLVGSSVQFRPAKKIRSFLMVGSLAAVSGLALTASERQAVADGYVRSTTITTPCASYGPDYAAVEGGTTCVRIGGRVRVELGSTANLTPGSAWAAGKAAPATLRSDATGSTATHLRVHGGLEYPNPFR